MSSDSKVKKWLGRSKWYFIVGVPLLCFALAPFPMGCAMIYPIIDSMRGHPQGPHGAHPQQFTGLWIRDETVEFDFLGQAFYLKSDGRLVGMTGMTETRWHFDDSRLFIDSVSRCGNCYRGNVTTEHTVRFEGANQMFVTRKGENAERGIAGRYRRVDVNPALRLEMNRLAKSTDDAQSFRAQMVLEAIDRSEVLSQLK